MDSYEFNKIAGAVLFALLVAFGLGMVSDIIYSDSAGVYEEGSPENPGYVIEVAASSGGGDDEEEAVPFAVILASADAASGENVAKKCVACHSFEQGGANKVGPNLWNVVGGPMAHLDGFGYSSALAARGEAGDEWTFDALDGFLANPRQYIQGTSMSFAGLRRVEERADMIAYLRSLSDNPIPLPEIATDEVKADEEATATDETLMETASTDETAQVEQEIAAAGEQAETAAEGQTAADGSATQAAQTESGASTAQDDATETAAATGETTSDQAASDATTTAQSSASDASAATATDSAAPSTATGDSNGTSAAGETAATSGDQTAAAEQGTATEPATGDSASSTATDASSDQTETAAATDTDAASSDEATASAAATDAGGDSFTQMVANGDVSKGENTFKRCQACHTIDEGGPNRVGPNLWNVVGRPVASVEGYKYSDAMKIFAEGGKTWTISALSTYLDNPKADVPKTKMVFPGIRKEDDRADLIAYLREQSNSPVPLQ